MPTDPSRLKNTRLLVIGDIMLDRYFWGDVDRISPEAPVPVVRINNKTEVLGGAGNVAANLAGLGCNVSVVAVRGHDNAGEQIESMLNRINAKNCLCMDAGRPTITKTRVMGQHQQLIRLDEEQVTGFSPSLEKAITKTIEKNIIDSQAVILSDYGKGMFLSPDTCRHIISVCRETGISVFIDPKGMDWTKYTDATCITPNASELAMAAVTTAEGLEENIESIALTVRKKYHLDRLLVTRGAKGMLLVDSEENIKSVPAKAKEVFDVSGAGDTVIATLAAGIASGLSFFDAAKLANTAAGIVVGKLGTQPITLEALKQAIKDEEAVKFYRIDKTASLAEAVQRVRDWREQGDKIVFTNGCFDLLHPGHAHLLSYSKKAGDKLVVGLNTDKSVKRLKGETRPIHNQQDRSTLLSSFASVDLVVLFDEDTPLQLIKALRPDILVKGADYRKEEVVGYEIVEAYGGKVQLAPIMEGYSTTGIADKLQNNGPQGNVKVDNDNSG